MLFQLSSRPFRAPAAAVNASPPDKTGSGWKGLQGFGFGCYSSKFPAWGARLAAA
jgi:hypothetical protein